MRILSITGRLPGHFVLSKTVSRGWDHNWFRLLLSRRRVNGRIMMRIDFSSAEGPKFLISLLELKLHVFHICVTCDLIFQKTVFFNYQLPNNLICKKSVKKWRDSVACSARATERRPAAMASQRSWGNTLIGRKDNIGRAVCLLAGALYFSIGLAHLLACATLWPPAWAAGAVWCNAFVGLLSVELCSALENLSI